MSEKMDTGVEVLIGKQNICKVRGGGNCGLPREIPTIRGEKTWGMSSALKKKVEENNG